jgi:hypothetical protein
MLAGLALAAAGLGVALLISDPAPTHIGDASPRPETGGLLFPDVPGKPPPGEAYEGPLSEDWNPLRVALLGAGLLLAGIAVQQRFKSCRWDLESRLETAALLTFAGVAGLLAYLGMARAWDSGHLFLITLIGVCLAAALLVMLPSAPRKILLSLWIVYHFGGIFVATTNQDPTGSQAPWMANKLWEYVYRPYLGFLWMNNAYHFYSPNPGPPELMWFRIEYSDEQVRWVNLPERDKSPVPLHYTRMIAMATSTSNPPMPLNLVPDLAVKQMRRNAAGRIKGIPELKPTDLLPFQYQEPNFLGKVYASSYIRHIAHAYPHPDGKPEATVKAVKLYRVVHDMLSPQQLADGESPLDLRLYRPYFLGEFKPDGSFTEDGAHDPFLYWLLPMDYDPSRPPGQELINSLDIHAGRKSPRFPVEALPK